MQTQPSRSMTADEILNHFGVEVDGERLTDGSKVWNVLLSDTEINCISEKHARELVQSIAVAIRNAAVI
jgi:hypothetical protein